MNRFEYYFDPMFADYSPQKMDISEKIYENGYLICGDFYGIQKFIFENLSTKNAAKVLRAKSAFVQIFTIVISRYICHKTGISENHILSNNAGKFEIIAPQIDLAVIEDIRRHVDHYFLHHFFGLSGISICTVPYRREDFVSEKAYKTLRQSISLEIEKNKYRKFSLNTLDSPVLATDETITNARLCKVCNTRPIQTDNCEICDRFIELGKRLASTKNDTISNQELGIIFDDFETSVTLGEKLRSYVSVNRYGKPATFEDLSASAIGTTSIGVLKADIDGMGNFLNNSDVTANFDNFDLFSKSIDNFFSLHVPKLMKERYPNTYTVFAGGDDLFLIGAWNEILELARAIRNDFISFVKVPLTLSFGIAMVKENTPVSYMATISEQYLEMSKEMEDKDAITLFGMPIKWSESLLMRENFHKIIEISEKFPTEFNTAFWYRILEFCDMRENLEKDMKNALWKSKLSYTFKRNVIDKQKNFDFSEIIKILSNSIDIHRARYKAVIFEELYKQRNAH